MSDLTERLLMYYRILIQFEFEDYRYRTEEFRQDIIAMRRNLRDFRWFLERAVNRDIPPDDPRYKSWRRIPFNVKKIKECRGCGRPFYDISRNGRLLFCHWIPYKRYNYYQDEYKPNVDKNGTPVSYCQKRHDSLRHPLKHVRRGFYTGTEND